MEDAHNKGSLKNKINVTKRGNKLWLNWVKLKLSLSYSFINFKLTFKNFSGGGLEQKNGINPNKTKVKSVQLEKTFDFETFLWGSFGAKDVINAN